jgi:hypothetical protein
MATKWQEMKYRTKTARLAAYQVDTGEVRQTLEMRVWGEGRVNASAVVEQLMQWLKAGMEMG